jgi:hypothetical protein
VYWQHITNGYLEKFHGAPPVPIFVWAHSINTRFLREGWKFHTAREVIDNLERLLGLTQKLALIYKKADVLVRVLNRFLGDVQMYAESDVIRGEINQRFCSVLERVPTFAAEKMSLFKDASFQPQEPEIYVVAHSEGTVVSYNSLVQAAGRGNDWLKYIKGLVTLGSPLDKHYTIWDSRFRLHDYSGGPREPRIPWFNYWDVSDPVGYSLQTLFKEQDSDAQKLFTPVYDAGFARYYIPGLAHVEYWSDTAILEDIIHRVMDIGTTHADTQVRSRWFGYGRIQDIGDRLAYVVARLGTLAFALFFVNRLLWLVRTDKFLFGMNLYPTPSHAVNYALWILAPLLLSQGLWKLFTRSTGVKASSLLWTRRVVLAVWVAIAVDICLAVSKLDGWAGTAQLKNYIGYFVGLVVTILVWQLHTTVHRGLVQMWRYTKGTDHSPLV